MSKAIVLGGGIAGLSAAHYLSKFSGSLFSQIVLIEGSDRLGGWMESVKTDNGAIFERGPRSLRAYGKPGVNTIELADELGLESSILAISNRHEAAQNRYVYAKGQINKMPNGFFNLFRTNAPFSQALIWNILKERNIPAPDPPLSDDSVYNFISRRVGSELAEFAADAVFRGIYAGDIRNLSIKSVAPTLFEHEQLHGSVFRGMIKSRKAGPQCSSRSELVIRSRKEMWSVWSLKNGIQQLSETIAESLRDSNVEIVTEAPCRNITFNDDTKTVKLMTSKGEFEGAHLFSTVPSNILSKILPESDLSRTLSKIPFVTVATLNIEYDGEVLPFKGFGHLVPSIEPSNILGVIYDSCLFPEHDRTDRPSTRLTVMMGGSWFEEFFGDPDQVSSQHLEQLALQELNNQLGIDKDPLNVQVTINKDCIAQYNVGHSVILDDAFSYVKDNDLPLSLLGSSYTGVGVNDCILSSRDEVEKYIETNSGDSQ
ncbi:protoporphyrinogen oxidase-like [Tubulanus polymorphus]|uniref:protoporphyrinogen oxidase-like n=1 Tax=Tubulanus polymorphus TaxID=672921 RepID=UPI003DA25F3B